MLRILACGLLMAGVTPAAEKPRVFLTESGVAEITSDAISVRKGTSAESIEVMKGFIKHCPTVAITANREKADYVVRFDREGINPTTPFVKGNKVAVFNREEDLVFSTSGRFLPGVVKATCAAVTAAR